MIYPSTLFSPDYFLLVTTVDLLINYERRIPMNNTAEQPNHIVNGVDADEVVSLATMISEDEDFGKFTFRANNEWINGARSRSSIQGFYAGGKENNDRKEALYVDADQPAFLGGQNTAPNPVEHLLHALDSCLTVTLVYHAAVQGIHLDEVKTSSEGDMNARGFFGISDQVNKGYKQIRVNMRVKSDADVDTLTTLAMFSPVYEVISRSVPIDFTLTKI
jgi:uncharacterized OsmC-like protein